MKLFRTMILSAFALLFLGGFGLQAGDVAAPFNLTAVDVLVPDSMQVGMSQDDINQKKTLIAGEINALLNKNAERLAGKDLSGLKTDILSVIKEYSSLYSDMPLSQFDLKSAVAVARQLFHELLEKPSKGSMDDVPASGVETPGEPGKIGNMSVEELFGDELQASDPAVFAAGSGATSGSDPLMTEEDPLDPLLWNPGYIDEKFEGDYDLIAAQTKALKDEYVNYLYDNFDPADYGLLEEDPERLGYQSLDEDSSGTSGTAAAGAKPVQEELVMQYNPMLGYDPMLGTGEAAKKSGQPNGGESANQKLLDTLAGYNKIIKKPKAAVYSGRGASAGVTEGPAVSFNFTGDINNLVDVEEALIDTNYYDDLINLSFDQKYRALKLVQAGISHGIQPDLDDDEEETFVLPSGPTEELASVYAEPVDLATVNLVDLERDLLQKGPEEHMKDLYAKTILENDLQQKLDLKAAWARAA